MRSLRAVALLALTLPPVPTATGISTSSGDVLGHPASARPAVTEFLGIPFARPPIGNLRFAPPVEFENSGGVINATTFSVSCPYAALTGTIAYPNKTVNFDRIVGTFLGEGGVIGEDCLTLNVWAKEDSTSSASTNDQGKPVMVFFYGGRFAIGGTNNTFYNGQYLADSEDVVVVTVNYRTNIFGFPGSPSTAQNLGLLDQRLALEWVRSNIATFSGDPTRITIFGQSAGSVSVDYHAFAFPDDPIASGLISHSGTAFSFLPNSAELTATYWTDAASFVGCANATSAGEDEDEEILECMRGKNFTDVLAAGAQVVAVGNPALLASPPFQPTVDNITVFADYAALSAAGKFAQLPYLLGSLHNESSFYRIRGFLADLNLTVAQWDLFTVEAFTCPTAQAAAFRAAAGLPTWRYRYFADWNNLRLFPGSGAYHGSDLEMVFGTGEAVSGVPNSAAEEKVSLLMRAAWAAFAKNAREGLDGIGWPRYDVQKETLVRIAFDDEEEVSFVNPSVYDAPCAALGGSVAGSQGAF
ncbi:Carboxylic ester hydrolase [Mycena sanguinolenta]|uniref:Carboxylic ester hydrolase n=1 Tax=Mycena sanguinolenta TaxID=230812 RepID=A0A8H7CLJ8_9AGAR|nr:Carboxylic ester hydrolase [Mycena sanguinolenta]